MSEAEAGQAAVEPEAAPTAAPEGGSDPLEGRLTEFMSEVRQELGGLRDTLTAEPEPGYGPDPGYGPAADPYANPYGPQDPYGAPQQPFGQDPQVPPGYQVLYDEHDNPVVMPIQQQPGMPGVQPGVPPQHQQSPWGGVPPELQQTVQSIQERLDRREMLDKVSQYEQRFPELQNEAVYKPAAEAAWQQALEITGGNEQEAARLASNPDFVVRNWLADRAASGAASETPAGGAPGIQLESAGGATPEPEERDEGQDIVQAMTGRNPFA